MQSHMTSWHTADVLQYITAITANINRHEQSTILMNQQVKREAASAKLLRSAVKYIKVYRSRGETLHIIMYLVTLSQFTIHAHIDWHSLHA